MIFRRFNRYVALSDVVINGIFYNCLYEDLVWTLAYGRYNRFVVVNGVAISGFDCTYKKTIASSDLHQLALNWFPLWWKNFTFNSWMIQNIKYYGVPFNWTRYSLRLYVNYREDERKQFTLCSSTCNSIHPFSKEINVEPLWTWMSKSNPVKRTNDIKGITEQSLKNTLLVLTFSWYTRNGLGKLPSL